MDRIRKAIANIANRSEKQSLFMFNDLCEGSLAKYLLLEETIAIYAPAFVPGDKETMKDFLKNPIPAGSLKKDDKRWDERFRHELSKFYLNRTPKELLNHESL